MEIPRCKTCEKILGRYEDQVVGECPACREGAKQTSEQETALPQAMQIEQSIGKNRKAKQSQESIPVFMGLLGGLGAGLLGMFLWYLIVELTGYEIGYIAIGIGALAGIGTILAARDRSTELGIIAGICAVVAIGGGRYLVYQANIEKVRVEWEKVAKKTVAIVQEDDSQIRQYVATALAEEGMTVPPGAITDEMLNYFEDNILPRHQDFLRKTPAEQKEMIKEKMPVGDVYLFLWLILGIGAAFKIASE